jgi:hypothetical protein
MKSKFLNIVLSASLIVSIIGISACKTFCYSLDLNKKSCCKKEQVKDCCSETHHDNISKGLFNLKSVDVPHLICHPNTYLNDYSFFSLSYLDTQDYIYYTTPILVKDISVLHRVFLI